MLWALVLSLFSIVQEPGPTLDWATIAVERQAFFEEKPGEYGTTPRFDGVGMVYIAAARKTILYRGLRRIATPHLGQAKDAQFEFHQESFTLRTVTCTAVVCTFEAVNDGPSARQVTGTMRVTPTKAAGVNAVAEFRLDEFGQTIKGVLNRYTLVKSPAANSLVRKLDSVFLGGNVAVFGAGK